MVVIPGKVLHVQLYAESSLCLVKYLVVSFLHQVQLVEELLVLCVVRCVMKKKMSANENAQLPGMF
ncbi:hypothetical protein A8C75_18635 [Marinobacterium aestuarii]|uniref:Uncharacterized protein n=1 Tax=Marinobacterium aestuarii TaxID=1821621 RepID=A0A1A9F2S4_9GAMM|nr:hypothetical protein A8C75_18635 [Marinobacterium aestuarii]